jgi:hypothetical protein
MKAIIGLGLYLLTLTTPACTKDYYNHIFDDVTRKSDVSARIDKQIEIRSKYLEKKIFDYYGYMPNLEEKCKFINELYLILNNNYKSSFRTNPGAIAIEESKAICIKNGFR